MSWFGSIWNINISFSLSLSMCSMINSQNFFKFSSLKSTNKKRNISNSICCNFLEFLIVNIIQIEIKLCNERINKNKKSVCVRDRMP